MNKLSVLALAATIALTGSACTASTTETQASPTQAWTSWDTQGIAHDFTAPAKVAYVESTTAQPTAQLAESYKGTADVVYVIHDNTNTDLAHVFTVDF